MENRRGIRNWDAFGTLYNFASRMLATELLEPVLKFTFDLSAALLLGVTFIFQSLSVLIALDVVVLSFYQVTCTYLCGILSALMVFIASERERTATVRALVKYLSNIMWVKIIYTVHPDCWRYMSGGPILAAALMHTLVGFYTERLNSEQSLMTQVLYSLFLMTLFLIVFNTIYLAPDHVLLETVFMLRCPIDTLCNAADTIFKLCDNALGEDNRLPVYTTQIARYSFWSAVHLLQFLLVNSTPSSATVGAAATSAIGRRADKYIYFFLFLHDLLELAVPVRHLLVQISNERYITKTFPKLTALELSTVCDETCPVCLSEHTRDTVRLRCNHLLHAGCLHSILRQNADSLQHSRCPMCRADIDIAPPRANSAGLFGTGMRGLRARSAAVAGVGAGRQAQVYRTVNAGGNNTNNTSVQATARGRFGTAEQLIADHLQQHNLQQGDVIHIRIVPRGSRASAAGSTTSTGTSDANTNTTPMDATTNTTHPSAGPQPLMPSHLAARTSTSTNTSNSNNNNSNSFAYTKNATTNTSSKTPSTTGTLHASPSEVMEVALQECEHTSVLRSIHAHGLHTDSENSSGSTSTSTTDVQSTAMDVHDNTTTQGISTIYRTNSNADSQDVNITNEEIEQLLLAANSAIHDTAYTNTSTAAYTSSGNGTTNTSESASYDNNTVRNAIHNYTPLPLSYVPHTTDTYTNTSIDTSTDEYLTTYTNTQYANTQVDSQQDIQLHFELHHSNSSGSSSGSVSGDESSVEDSDGSVGDDSSVAGTAHSSDDESESVDLLHGHSHTTTNTSATTICTTENINHSDNTTNHTTSTTNTVDSTTSPIGVKRKHSVIDLTASPPASPHRHSASPVLRDTRTTSDSVRAGGSGTDIGAGSVDGSGTGASDTDSTVVVKEEQVEPASKVQRVSSQEHDAQHTPLL